MLYPMLAFLPRMVSHCRYPLGNQLGFALNASCSFYQVSTLALMDHPCINHCFPKGSDLFLEQGPSDCPLEFAKAGLHWYRNPKDPNFSAASAATKRVHGSDAL